MPVKKIGIFKITQYMIFLSCFHSFLFVHNMLRSILKPSHIRICRHFSNPAIFLQYMTFRPTNIKTTAAKEILISHMHIQILLPARAIFFIILIFGYWRVFRMMCNSLSPLMSHSYTYRFIFNVTSQCSSIRKHKAVVHKASQIVKRRNCFLFSFWGFFFI